MSQAACIFHSVLDLSIILRIGVLMFSGSYLGAVSPEPSNGLNPSPPKLIGHRLSINGFLFIRNYRPNVDGRVHWECQRYKDIKCNGRAITSDPSVSKDNIVIYRGPESSKHNHLPVVLDMKKGRADDKSSSKPVGSMRPTESECQNEPSTFHSTQNFSGTVNGSGKSQPRLIGKRLFLDGYIYVASNHVNDRSNWECRRYRSSPQKCPARAITSSVLASGQLTIFKGPKDSLHNHAPNIGVVQEAEDYAEVGPKRRRKIQTTVAISTKNHDLRSDDQPQPGFTNSKRSANDAEVESERTTRLRKRIRKVVDMKQYRTTKIRSPLTNSSLYRTFLMNFLGKPSFDRKNVIEALRSIYKSDNACVMNYATILENRTKIERDIVALKANPDIDLVPLGVSVHQKGKERRNIDKEAKQIISMTEEPNGSGSNTVQKITEDEGGAINEMRRTILGGSNVDEEIPAIPSSQEKGSHDEVPPVSECVAENISAEVPPIPAAITRENRNLARPSIATTDSSEDEMDRETEGNVSPIIGSSRINPRVIPPVPAAIPIENLHRPETTVTISLIENDLEIKREIALVDLTGDSDIKREAHTGNRRQTMQVPMPTPACTTRNTLPVLIQNAETVRLNPPCGANQMASNLQIPSPSQYMYPFIQRNWYDQNMNRPLNYIPENPNSNGPYLIGDGQVLQSIDHSVKQKERNEKDVKLIGRRLYIDGFVYVKNCISSNGRISWECRRLRQGTCHARVTTSDPAISENIIVFRGLEKSSHNHASSLIDPEEAEALQEYIKKKKCDIQLTDQSHTIDQSHPDSQAASKIERKIANSYETHDKRHADEVTTETEPDESAHANAAKVTNHTDPARVSLSARMLGNRLYIKKFEYFRSNTYSGRIYWQCESYKSKRCYATAITSHPDFVEKLIVHKGPDESKHNHSSVYANMEEFELRERRKTIPAIAKASISLVTGLTTPIVGEKTEDLKSVVRPDLKEITSTSADSDRILNLPAPRLIGSMLCIDGYIYSKNGRSNIGGKIYWICRRYKKYKCQARATTSGILISQNLIIHKGPKESKHSHPWSKLEVEKAELEANFENGKERKPQATAKASTETSLKRSRSLDVQPLNFHDSGSYYGNIDLQEKPYEKKLEMQEGLLTSQPITDPGLDSDSSSPRLIGRRLCIGGYIYSPKKYSDSRIGWLCVRYQHTKEKCSAVAITSNYLNGDKLIVRRGSEQSKHNHPPSFEEVQNAKKIVTLDEEFRHPDIVQTVNRAHHSSEDRLAHKQSYKSNLKRSLQGPKSDLSALPKKRRKISASRKPCVPKSRMLLKDPDMYLSFLTKFMKKPIFDRENVVSALKSVYKSGIGCLMAYATVLEHRTQIENDLETLKKDQSAKFIRLVSQDEKFLGENDIGEMPQIPASTSRREAVSTETCQSSEIASSTKESPDGKSREKSADGVPDKINSLSTLASTENQPPSSLYLSMDDPSEDEIDVGQEIEGSLFLQTNKAVENSHEISTAQVSVHNENQLLPHPSTLDIDSRDDESKVASELEESMSLCEKKTDDEKTLEIIPPVPSCTLLEDLSPPILTKNVCGQKSQVEQEIPLIDLTDESNENQECFDSNQQTSLAAGQGDVPLVSSMLGSASMQAINAANFNFQCEANHLVSYVLPQPYNLHQYMCETMQELRFDSNLHGLYNFIPESSSIDMPYSLYNVQMPLLTNNSSLFGNDGLSNPDQLIEQVQVRRQSAGYQQF
ncbi:hypothetical protein QAD02_006752 [Eretmocerus hayati]|uniref:Uncharacterized protein n=1 Tax=Eretmocerus hayati TaxID=131215 RepID=A0ACC2N1S3_9HYME|nr:hypothetical protein QAD02_006752 [Eretmocerus hayati]